MALAPPPLELGMDPAAALALASMDPAALELALASMDQATLALAVVAGPSLK